MNSQEQIPRIGEELEEARRDLRETLTQVNHKVKLTEEKLSPEHLIKDRPIIASSLAALLGFLSGSSSGGSTIAAFAIGALLVSAFRARSSSE